VFAGFAACLIARLRRIPYVLNVSDLWPDHLAGVGVLKESSPLYRLMAWIVRTCYAPARSIVAMTPLLEERIRQRVKDPSKVTTILNGVDLSRFRPDPAGRTFAGRHDIGGGPIVSFIGTFATAYDFDCMVTVIERCARSVPKATFLFVGTGSQMGAMGSRLAACPNVRMIEWLQADEVPLAWQSSDMAWWILRDSDLARGTIPAKLFEAFACGVPVVAGQRGVGADVIERSGGGIVVTPGDVTATVAAIERILLSSTERRQRSAAARAWAETHFDAAIGAQRYETLIRSAAGR
jgi:glycosyltransferase involved in cell wall biosynthesis